MTAFRHRRFCALASTFVSIAGTAALGAEPLPAPRHVVVYHDPAWWAGTPANGGIS